MTYEQTLKTISTRLAYEVDTANHLDALADSVAVYNAKKSKILRAKAGKHRDRALVLECTLDELQELV